MESSGPAGTVSPASASGALRRARIPRPSPRPCRAVPGLPRHPRPSGPELRRAQCPALTSQSPHDPGSSLQQAERAARQGGVSTKAGRWRSASSLPARGRRGGAWGGRDLVGAGLLGVWAVFQRGVVGPLLLRRKATWALLDFLLH